MKRITRDHACYAMSKDNPPAACVGPGERVCFETSDCYSNNLKTPDDRFTKDMWDTVNPATGPLVVEGASPGEVLRVDIERIDTRDHAVMCVEQGAGALGERLEGVETVIYPIRDGRLIISDDLSVPIRPMIGVIGTAPAGEPVLNGTPGPHGANMDCSDLIAGTSVYLPVNVPGALLSMGDIHALQGDGEVVICGAEVSGEITIRATPMRTTLPTPCLESDSNVIFVAAAETLDECERRVLAQAHAYLTRCLKQSPNHAGRLMSLIGHLGVCQVVNPMKTMKFTLPKSALSALGMGARATEFDTGAEGGGPGR